MNKGSRFIILSEDKQQQVFVRRFLLEYGLAENYHDITLLPLPLGKGSGEQYVRERLANELEQLRRTAHSQTKALLVVIDADTSTVLSRKQTLDQECKTKNISLRQPHERVCFFIPKRNIETWIYFLKNDQADEITSYPKLYREGECLSEVKKLVQFCKTKSLPQNTPDSLKDTCTEFDRIR